MVCAHCLVTLTLTINETLNWLSLLLILMQVSFWWRLCSDRYLISPCPLLPVLMVSVDVKHHVYLLVYHWGRGGPFFEAVPPVSYVPCVYRHAR